MQLDSAGRFSIKPYFQDVNLSSKVVHFYLCWHKRSPRGEEKLRILIEVAESYDAPDPRKMFLRSVKVDSKCRVAMCKVLTNVYGKTIKNLLDENFLVYSQRGKLYIEKA